MVSLFWLVYLLTGKPIPCGYMPDQYTMRKCKAEFTHGWSLEDPLIDGIVLTFLFVYCADLVSKIRVLLNVFQGFSKPTLFAVEL